MIANSICGACKLEAAEWICECQGLFIGPACMAKHISTPGYKHTIRPIVDSELLEFIEEEKRFISAQRARLFEEIDIHFSRLLKDAASRKKEQVEQMTAQALQNLDTLAISGQRQQVLAHKARQSHVFSFYTDTRLVDVDASLEIGIQEGPQPTEVRIAEPSPQRPLVPQGNEELRFTLASIWAGRSWDSRGGVEAITLAFSKAITVTGISLVKQKDAQQPGSLERFEIIEGKGTRGRALYTHQRIYPFTSELPDRVLVRVSPPVLLAAQTSYTFKARLRGKFLSAGKLLTSRIQSYLEVAYERPVFTDRDEDSGSGLVSGVFLELYYFASR